MDANLSRIEIARDADPLERNWNGAIRKTKKTGYCVIWIIWHARNKNSILIVRKMNFRSSTNSKQGVKKKATTSLKLDSDGDNATRIGDQSDVGCLYQTCCAVNTAKKHYLVVDEQYKVKNW